MCSPHTVPAVTPYRGAGGASCGGVPCRGGSRVTEGQLTPVEVPTSCGTAALVTALEPGRRKGRATGQKPLRVHLAPAT